MITLAEFNAQYPSLGRDSSLLTEEEWRVVDTTVTETLRRLTATRIPLAPVIDVTNEGAGVKQVRHYKLTGRAAAVTDLDGEPDNYDAPDRNEVLKRTVVHHAGWKLKWRDLEASRRFGQPLDMEAMMEASKEVTLQEDNFAMLGSAKYGLDGFLDPTGALTQAATGDWATADNAFTTIDKAILQAEAVGVRVRPANLRLFLNQVQLGELRAPRAAKSGSSLTDLLESGLIGPQSVVHAPLQTAGTGTLVMLDPAYQKMRVTVDTRAEELPRVNKDTRGWVYVIETIQQKEPQATVKLTGI